MYQIDTVPTWHNGWTPLAFFLTMFIGGPILGYLLCEQAGVDGWATIAAIISCSGADRSAVA